MASRYFAWNEHEIHYLRRGMGDPLLLVHNLYPGASHEEFEHNIDALSRQFTVYAIDLLGFGSSTAPRMKYTSATYTSLLLDFVEKEIAAATHVMAAGISCAYVTEAATLRPERFGRLAYVCPRSEPVGLETPRWLAPLQRQFLSSTFGSGVYETLSGEYEIGSYLHNCFHDPRNVTRELIGHLHDQATKPGGVFAIASLMTGFLDSSILSFLPRVQSPILLVWGRHARPSPVEHSVRFSSIAPHCRLRILEQSGAWPHYEQSAKVNEMVAEFLPGDDE